MPDGAYLELISFTHPESHYPPSSPTHDARCRQPWANKACGWVAYAFLGAPRATQPLSALLNERLAYAGSTTRYASENAGGRTRPDGVEIRWEITPPMRWAEKEGGTRLPFFCGDVTPRDLRVRGKLPYPSPPSLSPFLFARCGCGMRYDIPVLTHLPARLRLTSRQVPTRPSSNTKHPNGALSIAHLRVLAPPNVFVGVATELTAIVGEPPIEDSEGKLVWLLDLPGKVTPRWHPQLILCEPDVDDEDELHFAQTHGAGLFEIGVRVYETHGKRGCSDTPFGRVAWIPV